MPADRTTTDNWLDDPYPSRAFQRVREFAPTARVANDSGVISELPVELRDLGAVAVPAMDGSTTTFDEQFERSNGEAVVVLKDGVIVYERYRNGMTPRTPHLCMSVTKSFVGAMLGIQVGKGLVAMDQLVTAQRDHWSRGLVRGLLQRGRGDDHLALGVAARLTRRIGSAARIGRTRQDRDRRHGTEKMMTHAFTPFHTPMPARLGYDVTSRNSRVDVSAVHWPKARSPANNERCARLPMIFWSAIVHFPAAISKRFPSMRHRSIAISNKPPASGAPSSRAIRPRCDWTRWASGWFEGKK